MAEQLTKEQFKEKKQAERQAVVDANTQKLHEILLTGENWQHFLETLADHPHRSPLNLAAIAASPIAGSKELRTYDEWNDLGATVKRGSKGVEVLVKDGKFYENTRWFGESQVFGGEDRWRGLANKNPQAVEEALASLGGYEPLTETEKWVFNKRYGLDEGALPPVAERELFARELMAAEGIGVPEMLRDLCNRISAASQTMDATMAQSQVESRYVNFEIPRNFVDHTFTVDDGKTTLVDVQIPPNTKLADGTDIGRFHLVVNESLTVDTGRNLRVSLPIESAKTGEAWTQKLKCDLGSRDEKTGQWISDVHEIDVPSKELAAAVTEQRERYIAEQRSKSQEKAQDAPKKDAPVANAPKQAKQEEQKPSAKKPHKRASSVDELAKNATAKAAAKNAETKGIENPTPTKANPSL